MAGIGLELNKLINKKSFLSKFSGYFFTISSCLGSMILGFILLLFIQVLARKSGLQIENIEKFICLVTNTVFLSMIIFSAFSLILSRYISDLIYSEKESNILSSFWGVLSISIPLSILVYLPILLISKFDSTTIILLLVLMAEFVGTWIATLYVTVLKHYKKITVSFILAIGLSLIISILFYQLHLLNLHIMLLIVVIIYGGLLLCLTNILKKHLEHNSSDSFEFLKWFVKYPTLSLTGLFSVLGTLIHFYLMWFSNSQNQIWGLMYNNPNYDFPAIFAFFSTLFTSITFIAVLEPNFYKKYKHYFSLLNGHGNYQEVVASKKEMINTLKIELNNLILKQIACTLFFVVILSQILLNLNIGINVGQIETFKLLCIGYSLYAIGNVILQLQLYFSDNKGAFITATTWLIIVIIGTIISIILGSNYWGMGLIIGGAAMTIVASFRLDKYLNKLEYYVLNYDRIKRNRFAKKRIN